MPVPFDVSTLNIPESSEISRLLAQCSDIVPVRFSDGDLIVREGEEDTDTYLLVRGSYVVEQAPKEGSPPQPNALSIETSDIDAPTFVGEMAYFGGGFRSATVRSSGACHAFQLKPEHIDIIIDDFPLLTRVLCRQFTERLREADEVLKEHHSRLAMDVQRITKNPEEVIYKRGEPADTLYQLLAGTVVREDEATGEEVAAATPLAGFLDPAPYLRGAKYMATVRAKTRAILVSVAKNSRAAFVRNYPELVLRVLEDGDE